MKKFIICCLFMAICLSLIACDEGNLVTGVEIVQYPNRIIYVAGVDHSLDLTGGIIYYTYKKGGDEDDMIDSVYENYTISHNIDFDTPGVYIVKLIARGDKRVLDKFAIQVIDENYINEIISQKSE